MAPYCSILVKLKDAGWGEDLDFMGKQGLDTMSKMPVVRQSSKLTEGGTYTIYYAPTYMLTDQGI